MTRTQIDLRQLDRPQLELLVQHLDALVGTVITAHNTLSGKLAETEEIADPCRTLLTDWSTFLKSAYEKSNAEVAGIVGGGRTDRTLN